MMGSFLTRGLVMVLGYTYPAYECFKTLEKNKPEIDQLRFWCQYWILVAVLTVLERIGDAFVSWLPMYSEAKLAFFVYLWYPKTRGTAYVYDTFLRPYVAKHETDIDRNLLELRARAGDIAFMYWQKAASYGQTRFFEIMQYVASQSPRPHAVQQQQQQHHGEHRPSPAPSHQQPVPQQQPQDSPASAVTGRQDKPGQEKAPNTQPPTTDTHAETTISTPAATDAPSPSTVPGEEQAMGVKVVPDPPNEAADPPPPETVMEEAIRVTSGKLRKTRATRGRY